MRRFLTTLLLTGTVVFAQAPATKKPVPAPTTKGEVKPSPAPIAGGFVGNSNSKVYHKPDCKQGAKMMASNKVAFASKTEAEKAGYKACKSCKA